VTPEQIRVANLVAFLLALTLAGLFRTGRARLCWSFTALVAAALLGNLLTQAHEALFQSWTWWHLKQLTYAALYMAIAVELASSLFVALPRARLRALVVLVTLIGVAILGVSTVSGIGPFEIMIDFQPRVRLAAGWMLASVIGMALYYRVPIHHFHRAILIALGAYLAAFSWFIALVKITGHWEHLKFLDPLCYAAAVAVWAWAAWRPEPQSAVSPFVLRFLQPWAVRA
jgi:hypothetical protein